MKKKSQIVLLEFSQETHFSMSQIEEMVASLTSKLALVDFTAVDLTTHRESLIF